ncbi:2-oxo acid dehydrogenase subunit E2 [Bacillus weihaiensis]|uniref:2-oxo acid dehydrogenase subunit E2 n=1 Tax=Bacillus weihaiensis TaxID=1547283 RepID=UPI002355F475|nr:2-oxo acid dehydrogenase subunit E2 [Bacillus weihaiensis]
MAKEIFMPKLSSTMEVGTLLQWYKEEGETVEVGDPLFEIMTDKINIEVEAYEEGILLKRYVHEDDEVPVNHVIGYIGKEGEEVPGTSPGNAEEQSDSPAEQTKNEQPIVALKEDHATSDQEKVRATPAARRVAREQDVMLVEVCGTGLNGRIHEADVFDYRESQKQTASKATPLARKVAADEHIDLSQLQGTGANGKVYRKDLNQHSSSASAVQGQKVVATSKKEKRVKMEGVRKIVAKRMQESKATAPHVTLTSEVDMTEAIHMRKQLLPLIEKKTGHRLSYTEIILKATAHALKLHESINVSLDGDEIVYHSSVNVGLAVAVESGLLVPVIKAADTKGLSTLTEECKAKSKAARDSKLKPDDMKGGTFTISNLGMYAIDAFTPVINQPESAILGVGRINEKPVGVNGSIELRPMMTLSLSFDHRVIDGAPAAAFLTYLKQVVEQPVELLL